MANILLLDDTESLRRLVVMTLKREGHTVTTAQDRLEASELAQQERFDLALVDQYMYQEDGLQFLSEIRRLQPTCIRVLVTGIAGEPPARDALQRGDAQRILAKPFRMLDLVAAVRSALHDQGSSSGQ